MNAASIVTSVTVGEHVPRLQCKNEKQPERRLFVLPDQGSQRIKAIAVLVDVLHTTPQAGLEILGVVFKDEHHHTPADGRESRPSIV